MKPNQIMRSPKQLAILTRMWAARTATPETRSFGTETDLTSAASWTRKQGQPQHQELSNKRSRAVPSLPGCNQSDLLMASIEAAHPIRRRNHDNDDELAYMLEQSALKAANYRARFAAAVRQQRDHATQPRRAFGSRPPRDADGITEISQEFTAMDSFKITGSSSSSSSNRDAAPKDELDLMLRRSRKQNARLSRNGRKKRDATAASSDGIMKQ